MNLTAWSLSSSIGGLVVKLAVAIRDQRSQMSASPGFDSRPMHFAVLVLFCIREIETDCIVLPEGRTLQTWTVKLSKTDDGSGSKQEQM